MELLIFLVTSGVPGLISYIYLRGTSYLSEQDEFMKKCTLSAFSLLSLIIFMLFYSWNMQQTKLNTIIKNFDIPMMFLAIVQTSLTMFIITYFILPFILEKYNKAINQKRMTKNLSLKLNSSTIGKLFEDENNLIFIEVHNYLKDNMISKGWLKLYEVDEENNVHLTVHPKQKTLDVIKFKEDIVKTFQYISSSQDYNIMIYYLKKKS